MRLLNLDDDWGGASVPYTHMPTRQEVRLANFRNRLRNFPETADIKSVSYNPKENNMVTNYEKFCHWLVGYTEDVEEVSTAKIREKLAWFTDARLYIPFGQIAATGLGDEVASWGTIDGRTVCYTTEGTDE